MKLENLNFIKNSELRNYVNKKKEKRNSELLF